MKIDSGIGTVVQKENNNDKNNVIEFRNSQSQNKDSTSINIESNKIVVYIDKPKPLIIPSEEKNGSTVIISSTCSPLNVRTASKCHRESRESFNLSKEMVEVDEDETQKKVIQYKASFRNTKIPRGKLNVK